MSDKPPRYGIDPEDGTLLDCEAFQEFDPASGTWRGRGRTVDSYFDAQAISDDEAARIVAASKAARSAPSAW